MFFSFDTLISGEPRPRTFYLECAGEGIAYCWMDKVGSYPLSVKHMDEVFYPAYNLQRIEYSAIPVGAVIVHPLPIDTYEFIKE